MSELFLLTGILLCAVPVFFYLTTRLSTQLARVLHLGHSRQRHVYWLYRQATLIRLLDRQAIAEAILLLQYRHLVRQVLGPARAAAPGQRLLQVSCAFGDFSRRFLDCCPRRGHAYLFDLVHGEVRHARTKLAAHARQDACAFFQGDARGMPLADAAFDHVLSFFLFHELPPGAKREVFRECLRVLRPGGTLAYAEFHRPAHWSGRLWAGIVCALFEPYAREMWCWEPTVGLDPGVWHVQRHTRLGGYFQVCFVTRVAA